MKKLIFSLFLALPLFATAYMPAPAQQLDETGDSTTNKTIFKGTIGNLENYKPLPDVVLTLTSLDGNLEKSVKTDKTGRFYLANVPAGNYSLCFEKPGFEKGVCQSLILKKGRENSFGFFMFKD